MSDLLQLVVSEGRFRPAHPRGHAARHSRARHFAPGGRAGADAGRHRGVDAQHHLRRAHPARARARRRRLRLCLRRHGALPRQRLQGEGQLRRGPAPDSQQDADDGADRPAALGQGTALQAARPGAGHRPHRLGQDHHAGLDDQHHQRGARRGPHRHHRRPDRVLPQAQEGASSPSAKSAWTCRTSPRRCAACCARTRT